MLKLGIKGFTLVEMAMMLLIVGLLLGGLLTPLAVQVEQQRIAETQEALKEIREALIGFALAQGRLPCPAAPTAASGTPTAGTENCALVTGVLPWAVLGTAETDVWGRRYSYRVTASFRDAVAAGTVTPPVSCTAMPAQSSFALCSVGDITVSDGIANIAVQLSAVVISHGANGRGGYTQAGLQIGGAAGDEAENADGDALFVSRNRTPADAPAGEFDDLAVWVQTPLLMNRMVAAGRLP